jgi:DNA-binding NarL/FixJ family response regulator
MNTLIMNMIRVFLADDHAIMREGLKLLINMQPDMTVVGEAGNGRLAYQQVRELKPDVVVMDLSMPEMDGVQATEAIKGSHPQVKVLILTVHEDEDYLRLLLKKGASGYVVKSAIADDLATAVRKVMNGGIYLDPALTEKLVQITVGKPAEHNHAESELSDREFEVMRLIAWGHTNVEIAEQLHLSVRTVETYKGRIMEKLGFQSRAELVRYALRRGWLKLA